MANTRQRVFRVDDKTWEEAAKRAAAEHRNMSDVIRVALRAYGENRYDAIEPPVRRTE